MFIFLLLFSVHISAQKSFSKDDAIFVIDTFFNGFHKADTLIMKSVVMDGAILQSAFKNRKGVDVVEETNFGNFINSIASKPSHQVWNEKILDYIVSIDGNLVHVWTPYEFYLNGVFSHCGANSFTIANINGSWKIIHLIDSRRREDCSEFKK
ncbi:hypothetical protein ULMA_13200 [Patiriisocius marinus]|uniref:3-methyl-2-oxobutanoate hydroxymethyltransferase n=2 Tax=Patiriisocius marinus TaxID=1397112 RepID=A0A5J4IXU3_9FLAO|nr:hypothetical protein ULMA_13200 [Patiriisocius marinus]